jgi:hypothetical protein
VAEDSEAGDGGFFVAAPFRVRNGIGADAIKLHVIQEACSMSSDLWVKASRSSGAQAGRDGKSFDAVSVTYSLNRRTSREI